MNVFIKLEGIDAALALLDPKKVERAASRAINKSINTGKTEASTIIRDKFNVKKSDLDKKIEPTYANPRQLSGTLILTGQPISLMYFNPTQIVGGTKIRSIKGVISRTKASMRQGPLHSGVRARIINKERQALLPKAFIARDKQGAPRVFARIVGSKSPERPGKEKLRAIKVVTYPTMLRKPENMSRLVARIKEQLNKNVVSEINFEITRGK